MRYSICFALTIISATSSLLFSVRQVSALLHPHSIHGQAVDAPSNTSGVSYFSGGRDFVIGTSGLTCRKFAREVRYAMLLDIIVRSCSNTISASA